VTTRKSAPGRGSSAHLPRRYMASPPGRLRWSAAALGSMRSGKRIEDFTRGHPCCFAGRFCRGRPAVLTDVQAFRGVIKPRHNRFSRRKTAFLKPDSALEEPFHGSLSRCTTTPNRGFHRFPISCDQMGQGERKHRSSFPPPFECCTSASVQLSITPPPPSIETAPDAPLEPFWVQQAHAPIL
jgi:hypothetical protein